MVCFDSIQRRLVKATNEYTSMHPRGAVGFEGAGIASGRNCEVGFDALGKDVGFEPHHGSI